MKKLSIIILCIFFFGCVRDYTVTPYFSGDCVDRAIQIRQELRKDGYQAEIVLGILHDGKINKAHAWIKYKSKTTNKWIKIINY